MKKERSYQHKTDKLIRHVLKDDLPPELEERMKERVVRFRKEIEQSKLTQRLNLRLLWNNLSQSRVWPWIGWVFRKESLAAVSVLMLVVGGTLQLAGHRSALADTVSVLNTSISVMNRVNRTETMECQMEMPGGNGPSLSYTIRWLSPNLTRVDAHKRDEMNKTLWITGSEIIIADHIKNTTEKAEGVGNVTDAAFQPVLWLVTPEELADRMYGRWQLSLYEQTEKPGQGLFIFINQEEKTMLEMAVDLTTYLPLDIKKFLPASAEIGEKGRLVMQGRFNWNQPVSPRIMIPKVLNKDQNV